jgi:superfamily II DNA or RNA helicase
VTLRPYQEEAVAAVHERWNDGDRATLLAMATGTGKTYTGCRIVADREAAGRTLWLAHRTELIDQAAETLRDRLGLDCNVEKADLIAPRHPDLWGAHPVVVGSVQTLKGPRLKEWPPDAFAMIVVDEAHHAPAKTYRAILNRFSDAKVLGLTATPDRGDTIGLWNVFDSAAFEYPIRRGIQEGYLCDILQKQVVCADLDLSDIKTVAGDLAQGDLEAALIVDGVLHQIAAPLIELAGDRQTLVFTAGVSQAHALADVIAGYLDDATRVAALDGSTPAEERARLIAGFRDGSIQYLINCAVLTEGFDAPETSCIAIARPTKSRSLYAQMIGRGTRIAEGKADCLVLDFVGNAGRHKLVCPLDVLAGKPIPPDIEREALDLIAEGKPTEEALREAEERALERARVAAERRARAAKVRADVAFQARSIDPFDILGVEPCDYGPPASEKQITYLRNLGVDVSGREWGKFEASRMIDKLAKRRGKGLCTYKQARLLAKHGLPTEVSFEAAKQWIDTVANHGWRCPEWLQLEAWEGVAV